MSEITEIVAKQIVRKKPIDAWFVSKAHLNIYRGCTHNCAYCDGRDERYYVPEPFTHVSAKINAHELLDRALNPKRKRKPITSGFVVIGGGVSDSYQHAEKKLHLSRKCLEVVSKWNQPAHILTKSELVTRDIDVLKEIQAKRSALVSFSFSGVDDTIARHFEPGCALPSVRLNALEQLKQNGLNTGVFLMPVIPGITDTQEKINDSVKAVKDVGVDFVLFGGMTLKVGRQMEHYMNVLNAYDETLQDGYQKIYTPNKWGGAHPKYYRRIEHRFLNAARKYRVKRHIPLSIVGQVCSVNDFVIVALQQLEQLQRVHGWTYPFFKTGMLLAKWDHQLLPHDIPVLTQNPFVADCIKELLSTQNCSAFDELSV